MVRWALHAPPKNDDSPLVVLADAGHPVRRRSGGTDETALTPNTFYGSRLSPKIRRHRQSPFSRITAYHRRALREDSCPVSVKSRGLRPPATRDHSSLRPLPSPRPLQRRDDVACLPVFFARLYRPPAYPGRRPSAPVSMYPVSRPRIARLAGGQLLAQPPQPAGRLLVPGGRGRRRLPAPGEVLARDALDLR